MNILLFFYYFLLFFVIMNKLVLEKFLELKIQNCVGCQVNHPSQKNHFTCLTNINDDFIFELTLQDLLKEKKISIVEFKWHKQCWMQKNLKDQ